MSLFKTVDLKPNKLTPHNKLTICKQMADIKLNFYHEEFLGYCLQLYCYFHNVSADISSGLLQVFVKLENIHGISNYIFYWIHRGRLFSLC